MATHASADKAARQSLKRRDRNQQELSKLRTKIKKFRTALATKVKDKAEGQKAWAGMLDDVQRTLMKAANKNVIKMKTASRNVSRLSAAMHKALNG